MQPNNTRFQYCKTQICIDKNQRCKKTNVAWKNSVFFAMKKFKYFIFFLKLEKRRRVGYTEREK